MEQQAELREWFGSRFSADRRTQICRAAALIGTALIWASQELLKEGTDR